MSRYLERAENTARFIEVNQNLTLEAEAGGGPQWLPLIDTAGDRELFEELYPDPSRDDVIRFLAFEPLNPNSIHSCLARGRENARTIRENITTEMWEETNTLYHLVKHAASDRRVLRSPYQFLSRIKLASLTLIGITDATMSHGEPWHFVRLGRLLERADKTTRILDVKYYMLLPRADAVGTPLDVVQWSALLKSASALEMYRKSHGRIAPAKVAQFLLLDRLFPRSVRFSLIGAEDSLHAITGTPVGTFMNRAEQLLGRLRSELDYTHVSDVIDSGMHEFIDGLQAKLNDAGDAVHATFFAVQPEADRMLAGV
ncbi:MAG: alpha-E domain-containing protein [Planctomycetota bacterium]|nr:alpha-E domain-containing protein [Planctomycetota bacterium]